MFVRKNSLYIWQGIWLCLKIFQHPLVPLVLWILQWASLWLGLVSSLWLWIGRTGMLIPLRQFDIFSVELCYCAYKDRALSSPFINVILCQFPKSLCRPQKFPHFSYLRTYYALFCGIFQVLATFQAQSLVSIPSFWCYKGA